MAAGKVLATVIGRYPTTGSSEQSALHHATKPERSVTREYLALSETLIDGETKTGEECGDQEVAAQTEIPGLREPCHSRQVDRNYLLRED